MPFTKFLQKILERRHCNNVTNIIQKVYSDGTFMSLQGDYKFGSDEDMTKKNFLRKGGPRFQHGTQKVPVRAKNEIEFKTCTPESPFGRQ